MATLVMERFTFVFARLFPLVEPFTPQYISYYARRQLRQWKRHGLILSYNTSARRLGKLHYKFIADVSLTQQQARRFAADFVARILHDEGGES